MEGGKRKPSKWNLFVKKIFQEGKKKDSSYQFQQALVDASKRKGEMGSMSMKNESASSDKKSRKHHKKSRKHLKKSRKNRKH